MKILYCEQPLATTAADNDTPTVTLLTDSSLSRNHRPLFLPPHCDSWVITVAPALRVSRLGKYIARRFAYRYYDAVSLMLRLRPAGGTLTLPASATATAFDSAVVAGEWIELPTERSGDIPLHIEGSGLTLDTSLDTGMIDRTVEYLSRYFTLRHGDIIVPGDLPATLDAVMDSSLKITLDNTDCIDIRIK